MTNLTEKPEWIAGIYQLETSDPVLGGPNGIANRQARELGNRTQWLKEQQTQTHQALIEHERSRNHPDASLYAKGMVKLTDNINLSDSTLAATAKAVKTVSEQSCLKAQNLADLTDKSQAVINLGLQPTIASANQALPKTGGEMTGNITFINDSTINWQRHTDQAAIGFKNDSDTDTDAYLYFNTGDNGNEYFKWQHQYPNGSTHEWMNLKIEGLTVNGNISAHYQDSNAWADQYHTKAPLYTDITNNGPSSYHPLTKIRATIPNVASWAISQGVICQSGTIAYHLHMKGSSGQDINFAWDTAGNYHVPKILTAGESIRARTDVCAGNGASYLRSDGLIYGPGWGGWAHEWMLARIAEQVANRATWDWVNQHFVTDVRLGAVESVMAWKGPGYHDQPPYVITGVYNHNYDAFIDVAHRRPLQKCINGVWYNVWGL